MRLKLFKNALIASVVMVFAACSGSMGETDTRSERVKNLLDPKNETAITLEDSDDVGVYFKWEYVDEALSGVATYRVAFDITEGDFSDPIYIVASDRGGYDNHVSISHRQMNRIARMAGIQPSETGTFKWTVFASKGENTVRAVHENSITITRLDGFKEFPAEVYITGEATEGGNDPLLVTTMKRVADGEFEVYTRLEAGKPYHFVDNISGTSQRFSTTDGAIKEGGESTVAVDGIYRITLNFNTGLCAYDTVERLGFYYCSTGEILFDLDYVGYGVFSASRQTVVFDRYGDDRYKFRMVLKDSSGAKKEVEWGAMNQTDSQPTADSPQSYYHLQLLTNITQWNNKWRLRSIFDGVAADYTVYLSGNDAYTHAIEL